MKLVDTSAWVEFLRRQGDAQVKHTIARLLQADQAAYTCPIRFELLSGAKSHEEMIWSKPCHCPRTTSLSRTTGGKPPCWNAVSGQKD
jgi:hypothetical protein